MLPSSPAAAVVIVVVVVVVVVVNMVRRLGARTTHSCNDRLRFTLSTWSARGTCKGSSVIHSVPVAENVSMNSSNRCFVVTFGL